MAKKLFLCHSGRDKALVRLIADILAKRSIDTWFDERDLIPGTPWIDQVEAAIRSASCALVMIGDHGVAPWARPEIHACLDESVTRGMPVIPVLLPGAPQQPELPTFLKQYAWVDLRSGVTSYGVGRIVDAIGPGSPGQVDLSAEARSVPGCVQRPRHSFCCGSIVPRNLFIDRTEQFEDARTLLRDGQNFLIVGEIRAGKTSFCKLLVDELIHDEAAHTLAGYLNLETCVGLTTNTFLAHTIINLAKDIAKEVFGLNWAAITDAGPASSEPIAGSNSELNSLRSVIRSVKQNTHYRRGQQPSTLVDHDFIIYVHDLLSIMKTQKRWQHYVLFYDEANHLAADLSVDLLTRNAGVLEAAGLNSVYAASPRMAETFVPLRDYFSRRIELKQFKSVDLILELLARYYFGDSNRAGELPIEPEAVLRMWELTRGRPYQIQLLADKSFEIAHRESSTGVNDQHVESAIADLRSDRPSDWSETRDNA
jgi:type II secretory pathway predicted ATPase ExeA